MRDRLTTLACALGALLVFTLLFVHTGPPGARDAAVPTTAERRAGGLLGVATWLREEGIPVVSLRQRFGALTQSPGIPATGNLLIVTLPAATAFRTDEAVALDGWVRRGNTLLILAALADRPDWARSARGLVGDLQLLSGLEVQARQAGEAPAQDGGAAKGVDAKALERAAHDSLGLAEPIQIGRAHV